MDKMKIIQSCHTETDLSEIIEELNAAKEYYNNQLEEYNRSPIRDDFVKQNNRFFILSMSKANLEMLENKFIQIQSEVAKSKYAISSSVIGDDLGTLQTEITRALEDYKEKNSRYLASPHSSWARRNLLPGVNQAKEYLETLKRTYEEMQSALSKGQSIDLVDLTMEKAEENTQTEIPWKTIGLAVGALVVIVVIVKVV